MWEDIIQTEVFSKLKKDSEIEKLQKEYPDFTLTTSPVSSGNPAFPTLLLQKLESLETGQDLNNLTVNYVNIGFQIDVVDNLEERTRVNRIIRESKRIMKSMRFNIQEAQNQDTRDEKRSTIRATRTIGSGDTL